MDCVYAWCAKEITRKNAVVVFVTNKVVARVKFIVNDAVTVNANGLTAATAKYAQRDNYHVVTVLVRECQVAVIVGHVTAAMLVVVAKLV